MAGHDILLFLSVLLTLALLAEPLATRLHLPFPALLVLLGFIGSEFVVWGGFDTGIRFDDFHDLIVFVFLPVLVFSGALTIDPAELRRNLPTILFLAVPLLLLSTLAIAVLVYFGIGHPTGFPWIAALLTGALLSATDPMAVISLFERVGAPSRLALLLDGESLLNDAGAIVLFALFLGLATDSAADLTLGPSLGRFVLVLTGGLGVGAASGLVFVGLTRLLTGDRQRTLLSLICAYAGYLSAEILLNVSGVMAVMVAGLILGHALRNRSVSERNPLILRFWDLAAYSASALVFLLMGVTVTLAMFQERWLAMLIGIGGVLVARALGVYLGLPMLALVPGVEGVPLRQQTVLYWGGVRGAVTLALALTLPVHLEYWWTIQSIAFGVVLFTLFVQTPTLPFLLRRLG